MNIPKLYARHNDKQRNDSLYVLDNYLGLINWSKNDRTEIVDIGCGDGYTMVEVLLPKLLEKCDKIVGCDLSDSMVQFAKNRYGNARTDFVQMDIATNSLSPKFCERFQHAFSFYCMHWVPDQRQAFENVYKMLRPGGDMLLTFLASHPIFDAYEGMSKNNRWTPFYLRELISPYHNCKKPKETLEKLLHEVGFQNTLCKIEDMTYAYTNMENLRKSIVAVNPKLANLTSAEISEYLQDYFKEVRRLDTVKFVNNSKNQEEGVVVEYKLFVVYARKPLKFDYKNYSEKLNLDLKKLHLVNGS